MKDLFDYKNILYVYCTLASLKLNKSESLEFPANLTAWRHSMLPNKEYWLSSSNFLLLTVLSN